MVNKRRRRTNLSSMFAKATDFPLNTYSRHANESAALVADPCQKPDGRIVGSIQKGTRQLSFSRSLYVCHTVDLVKDTLRGPKKISISARDTAIHFNCAVICVPVHEVCQPFLPEVGREKQVEVCRRLRIGDRTAPRTFSVLVLLKRVTYHDVPRRASGGIIWRTAHRELRTSSSQPTFSFNHSSCDC